MSEEPTLGQIFEKVTECDTKVDKMITGLYGSLDKPSNGFIPTTNSRLDFLENKKRDRQWFSRIVIGTVTTAVVLATLALGKGLLGL